MEEALIAYLRADSAVMTAVGARVYWGTRPVGSDLPAIAMYVISINPTDSNDDDSDLDETRVQIDCLGATFAGANAAARSVRALIEGKSFTHDSVVFQGVFMDNHTTYFERSLAGVGVHRISVDYLLWHAT